MAEPFISENGISIPDDLASQLIDINSLTPNTWNPNRMESFMRDKLRAALMKDGFIVPVIVRPLPPARRSATSALWEIIDGEHRYKEALELGMTRIPAVNVGPVSDESAKMMTVKANTLRGEFDAVKLAEMVADLSSIIGTNEVIQALPYTPERIQSMIDLIHVDPASLILNPNPAADKEAEAPVEGESFRELDPAGLSFEHTCPRCKFGFNSKD